MGTSMTPPFPTVHTEANRQALARAVAARELAEQASAWLAELDEALDASPLSGGAGGDSLVGGRRA